MQKTTKVVIGAVVVLLIGAALVFSNTGLMKGSMQGLKLKPVTRTLNKAVPLAAKVPTVKKVSPIQLPYKLTPGANNQEAATSAPNGNGASTTEQPTPTHTPTEQQPAPQPQPVAPGTLSVSLDQDTPGWKIIMARTTRVPFSNYTFAANGESFIIKKLDVVLDDNHNFSDDPAADDLRGARNIARVGIAYGATYTTVYADSEMINGTATFSNLNIRVPKDGTIKVRVIADIKGIDAGAVSGQRTTLALSQRPDEFNNFEALGELSSAVVTSASFSGNYDMLGAMTVRKTVPTLSKAAIASTKLGNGVNELAALTIKAGSFGSVAVKRVKFEFKSVGNPMGASVGPNVGTLKLYKRVGNSTVEENITDRVSIKNKAGQDLKSGEVELSPQPINGLIMSHTEGSIFVAWDVLPNDEEVISREIANTYILRANIANAQQGDSISTFVIGDSSGITDTYAGLADGYGGVYDEHFIWSDMSAPGHSPDTADWATGGSGSTAEQKLTFF